jgi:predicted DNA-binding transcriptional regulator YafY
MAHERRFITFRYRLAAVLAQGEISQRFMNQRIIERLPSGDVIIEAEGRSEFFIRRTLLRYAGNAELLEPAWLREQMATDVAALTRLYNP